jgi:hypothetical protein
MCSLNLFAKIEEGFEMEPMVACALGIVFYCCYLTVKDIFSDICREGLLGPLSNWLLSVKVKGAVLAPRELSRRARVVNNSLNFWHNSSPLPYLGLQQSAARRTSRIGLAGNYFVNGR